MNSGTGRGCPSRQDRTGCRTEWARHPAQCRAVSAHGRAKRRAERCAPPHQSRTGKRKNAVPASRSGATPDEKHIDAGQGTSGRGRQAGRPRYGSNRMPRSGRSPVDGGLKIPDADARRNKRHPAWPRIRLRFKPAGRFRHARVLLLGQHVEQLLAQLFLYVRILRLRGFVWSDLPADRRPYSRNRTGRRCRPLPR